MSGIDSFTKLMLHGDGPDGSTTITDSEIAPAKTITIEGSVATISTAQSVFGGASILFAGGNAKSIYTADALSDFNLDTKNFVFDGRFRFTANNATYGLFNQYNSNTGLNSSCVCYYTSGAMNFSYIYSVAASRDLSFAWTPTANTWYHLAIIRSGQGIKFFVDGVQVGATFNMNADTILNSTDAFYIGAIGYTAGRLSAFNGYIDEFRVSVGTDRGWYGGFTPPTAAYDTSTGSAGMTPRTFYWGTA